MTQDEIKAARMAARSDKPLAPTGRCRFCNYPVPRGALWCATECAQDYAAETRALKEGQQA